jgi:hypothetical protein
MKDKGFEKRYRENDKTPWLISLIFALVIGFLAGRNFPIASDQVIPERTPVPSERQTRPSHSTEPPEGPNPDSGEEKQPTNSDGRYSGQSSEELR